MKRTKQEQNMKSDVYFGSLSGIAVDDPWNSERKKFMNDWNVNVEDRSVTHLPSASHFWFYNYPNANDVAAPKSMKLGSAWDGSFSSEEEICRVATNVWRAHLGVEPLKG